MMKIQHPRLNKEQPPPTPQREPLKLWPPFPSFPVHVLIQARCMPWCMHSAHDTGTLRWSDLTVSCALPSPPAHSRLHGKTTKPGGGTGRLTHAQQAACGLAVVPQCRIRRPSVHGPCPGCSTRAGFGRWGCTCAVLCLPPRSLWRALLGQCHFSRSLAQVERESSVLTRCLFNRLNN